jgi:hypothetical protein
MPRPDTHTAEEPLAYLEPGQPAADRSRPVPRAQLSTRTRTWLWALRILVLLLALMVTYTFIIQIT